MVADYENTNENDVRGNEFPFNHGVRTEERNKT
jgi:hypothetical protein